MKVPINENRSVLNPQNVVTPHQPKTAPEGVFGENEAQNNNVMGRALRSASKDILNWQAKKRDLAEKQIIFNLQTEYSDRINEALNSNKTDPDGKPVGLLMRKGINAGGTTNAFGEINTQLEKDILAKAADLTPEGAESLRQTIVTYGLSNRYRVADHEAKENIIFKDEKYAANIADRMAQASNIADPNILKQHINDGARSIEAYLTIDGKAPEVIAAHKANFAGKMLKSSLDTILQQEGIGKARETLDTMKDDVKPEVYNALSKGVDIWGIEAAIVDDPAKADPVIDRAKFLSPFEKEKYKNYAFKMFEKNKNTIFEKPIKDFVSEFDALYDQDHDLAYNLFTQVQNDIYSAINPKEKYKLDTRQMTVAYEYMSKQIGGDIYFKNQINKEKVKTIRQQESTFHQLKADYQSFGVDKKTGLIKNDVNVGTIANFIQTLDTVMTSGAAGARDTDIIEMQEQLRFALGQIAIKDGADIKEKAGQIKPTENLFKPDIEKIKQNSFFKSPKDMAQEGIDLFANPKVEPILKKPYTIAYDNETYLKERIIDIKKDEVFFNLLSYGENNIGAKNLGLLWETVYKEAARENINLKTNDTEGQRKITNILSRTKRSVIQNLYGLEDGDYEDVLLNGHIVKLSTPEVENSKKGFLIPAYGSLFKPEEQDGDNVYVRRNRGGKIEEVQKISKTIQSNTDKTN